MSAGLLVCELEGILKVGGWLEQPDSQLQMGKSECTSPDQAGTDSVGGQVGHIGD
jgi:hypothetical protein